MILWTSRLVTCVALVVSLATCADCAVYPQSVPLLFMVYTVLCALVSDDLS